MTDKYIYEVKKTVTKTIKCEDGKVSQVLEYDSKIRVEIPLNNDGSVQWFDDSQLLKK